jgi:subtilisin family serine protease
VGSDARRARSLARGFSYVSNGTSFSSPMVAGEAALVVSRHAALKSWPEAVRAIVMATAWHNIEGAAALSGMDGAGGIDARAAVLVTGRGRGYGFQYGTLTASSFDNSGFVTTQSMYIPAGRTARACLSFDSVVSGSNYASDVLVSDLDLYVYNPAGQLVAWSVSGIQPFEMVQFTAATSGTYQVRVRRYRLGSTYEYYGTALSVSTDI